MAGALIQTLIPVGMIALGLITGHIIEKSHLARLDRRQDRLSSMTVNNLRNIPTGLDVKDRFLVMGCAVIATDYFKVFAAGLRGFFGGEMKTYKSLMDRARREALVRMLEQAAGLGAESVYNVRFETSTIQGKRKPGGIEVLAYGTAIKAE